MLQYNVIIKPYGKLHKIKLQFTQEPYNSNVEYCTQTTW